MKVPLSWLREFAPVEQEPEELADILTSRGLKVEGIDRPWDGLAGVVVARVVEKRPHPNSDRLTLATLDAGGMVGHVAAGVANWEVGDLVPYAPPGSRVPVLSQPLETRRLRGEPSEGMICSPRELAISADHGGILILPADAPVGAQVKDLFGLDEVVFDVEIKANRPDLLSVLGVAREAAAAAGVPLRFPDTSVEEADEPATAVATVEIADLERCPRYLARVIRGVSIGPSPLRTQGRLTAAGMRPISNIVDATNYVMLAMGQPLHAFDLACLAGPGIVVRRAADRERMVTLDGAERVLSSEDLVIADLERSVAIAGVMGSALAEVSADTTDVLLESAHFARAGVIRTSRRLDLRTEASDRFERGTDPEGVPGAASRAASRIVAWAGGRVCRGVVEAGGPPQRRRLAVRPERAARVLGLPVRTSDVVDSLGRIGIGIAAEPRGSAVEVEVPSWRVDLEREIDLIEEVIRVEGYDRVGETRPAVRQAGSLAPDTVSRRRVRAAMVRAGLREMVSYPFVSAADLEVLGQDPDATVAVRNPLMAGDGYLRPSLLPGLFRAVRLNAAQQVRTIALFEVGHVFRLNRDGDPSVEEREHVAAVFAGAPATGLRAEGRPFDFFDAKGALEALMEAFSITTWDLSAEPADTPGRPAYLHPTRSATVRVSGTAIGIVGELDRRVAERIDAGGPAAVLELDVAALRTTAGEVLFQALPRFPPVRRDLAFVVDAAVPVGRLEAGIEVAGAPLVSPGAVELFDVFEGPPLPSGMKNVAFSVAFRASDRTLTDPEVTEAVGRIAEWVAANAGGELRTG